MLQMRPNCEACDKDLAPDAHEAYICSFECTFCVDCANVRFKSTCPNCGGNLVRRPSRPTGVLEKYPGSVERITKTHA
ncbi:MAG: DUF1272 domain-containing protein [Gammaproteobacteria bacterium]|nr:DUF1272 domain-containing protein [Gammaproteobacteria bacterium]